MTLAAWTAGHSVAAESYIVVETRGGHILAGKDHDEPRQVASLTKVATTLVALNWLREVDRDTSVRMTVTEDALSGGVNPLNLRSGDAIPMESALHAAMMASDNTSAYVIAEYVGSRLESGAEGDAAVAAFVDRMNALAARLGMAKTSFVNPHGLEEGEPYGVSTAADMARLAIEAYRSPDFPAYCAAAEKTVTYRRDGREVEVRLLNTNELVGSRGIDGVKTGTTWRAGACLMASAARRLSIDDAGREHRLVTVVLKSEERFRETVLLLNEAWPQLESWLRSGGPPEPNESLPKAEN